MPDFVIPLIFLAFILLNILIFRLIINRALRKYIEPDLKEKGMFFERYKWLGFFNTGDFAELTITFGGSNASARLSIYIDVYYQSTKEQKRTTVRIDTFYLFIRRVKYSSDL
jgi:hypothetical protein